tara:strand:- start:32 stop:415 length:384 start_codon:yes stop_codon:yes gene_type:complete
MFTKIFWQKVWVWIKNYWYLPALLVYTIVLWIFFRKKANNLVKLFDITKESYEKQIEALNKAHEEEIKKRNQLISTYQETLKSIEEEHNVKLNDLDSKKRKEIDKLSKNFEKDPEDLAKEMRKLFGV